MGMLHLLPGTRPGQYDICPLVDPVRKAGKGEDPFHIDILFPDDKIKTVFKCVCKHVIAGKTSVGNEDRGAAIREAVEQLAEGSEFILFSAGLDNDIQVSFGKQVKKRNRMDGVKSFF